MFRSFLPTIVTVAVIFTVVNCCGETVKKGSRGDCVKEVQRAVGTSADGIFGANTEAAVKRYQSQNGLTADGIVGAKTWAAISGSGSSGNTRNSDQSSAGGCSGVVKKGSRGDCVKLVQRAVGVSADGIFGTNTEAAVKRYQRQNGLTADGIVGTKTWAAISGSGSGSGNTGNSDNSGSGGCNSGDKYEETLNLVFKSEGNCQNWAKDTGNVYKGRRGYTCMGITPERGYQQRQSFSDCDGFSGQPADFVKWCYDRSKANFKAGAKQIYKREYIDGTCDHLDQPAFYVCTDISINSGPGRAKKYLKELGPQSSDVKGYAKRLNEKHRQLYKSSSQTDFKKGWLKRADERDQFIDSC